MGVVEGQVAFITGAARGQGRSHAVKFAQEGADIIALDICEQIESVPYPMSSEDDLEETVRLVEKEGRRIVAIKADVRDADAVKKVVDEGVQTFGRLDVVVANAGISPVGDDGTTDIPIWNDAIAVNLTGVWNTVRMSAPAIIEGGRGGSITLISSTAGMKGMMFLNAGDFAYTASKHGVVGLMRSYAMGLAKYSIRVNTIHPSGVATPMLLNPAVDAFLEANPAAFDNFKNPLPVEMLDAEDISNAIVWLASPAARYVTGVMLPVDAGYTAQ
jgi:SDR family mycofactocin-dependent oxidoreductase